MCERAGSGCVCSARRAGAGSQGSVSPDVVLLREPIGDSADLAGGQGSVRTQRAHQLFRHRIQDETGLAYFRSVHIAGRVHEFLGSDSRGQRSVRVHPRKRHLEGCHACCCMATGRHCRHLCNQRLVSVRLRGNRLISGTKCDLRTCSIPCAQSRDLEIANLGHPYHSSPGPSGVQRCPIRCTH